MIKLGFKKHRLVDLVGIAVFFLALVTAVLFFLRRATYVTIVMRVSDSDSLNQYGLPMWYLGSLKEGMVQKDILGKPLISILKKYTTDTNTVSSSTTFLTMKLLTTYDVRNETYLYEGVPILVGSYQNFKIKGVFLRGVVYRILDKNYEENKKKILVEGYLNPVINDNQDPYAANTFSNGIKNYLADKFVSGVKRVDSEGVVLAEIKEVKKLPSTRRFVYQNRIVEQNDPERQQVFLKVIVTVEKVNGVYLYEGVSPVRINGNFWLGFDDFDGGMTITGFKEI